MSYVDIAKELLRPLAKFIWEKWRKPKRPPLLLVEDSSDDREVFRRPTELYELELLTATTGEEALVVLSQRKDLKVVVLDLKLPGMDGGEVANKMKDIAAMEQRKLDLTIYSGGLGEPIETLSKRIGGVSILPKTENPGEAICAMLDERGFKRKKI